MKRRVILLSSAGVALVIAASVAYLPTRAARVGTESPNDRTEVEAIHISDATEQVVLDRRFEVQVLVNGRPLDEYYARGKSYVEAIEGPE